MNTAKGRVAEVPVALRLVYHIPTLFSRKIKLSMQMCQWQCLSYTRTYLNLLISDITSGIDNREGHTERGIHTHTAIAVV